MITERTRLIDVTVGDFIQFLKERGLVEHKAEKQPEIIYTGPDFRYGLAGIAEVFGCSTRTAQRIKDSGKYKGAIVQNGRTIITDVRKLMAIINNQ